VSYTNATGFTAIMGLIEEIEGIGQQWFGHLSPQEFGAGGYPMVWVHPLKWTDSDEVDPAELTRTVAFEIRLITRGDGNLEPFQQLDQLGEAIHAAVLGNDLGGAIPGETWISRGRYESKYPEELVILEGSFSYVRDGE
jgi:hypothetical protein